MYMEQFLLARCPGCGGLIADISGHGPAFYDAGGRAWHAGCALRALASITAKKE